MGRFERTDKPSQGKKETMRTNHRVASVADKRINDNGVGLDVTESPVEHVAEKNTSRSVPECTPDKDVLEKEYARRHLNKFFEYTYPALFPPSRPFESNWHIDCVCEHLEAVTSGQIRYLVINIPPRHAKSLMVSVFWPLWEWLHDPALQYIVASYADNLVERDALRAQQILHSKQYKDLMKHVADIDSDFKPFKLGRQKSAHVFNTTAGGLRISTTVGGWATGGDADRKIVDDPHKILEAESETVRSTAITWFDETLKNRINDPERDRIVMIAQRSHENDLCGHWLREGLGEAVNNDVEHLCLPGVFEGEQRSRTSLHFEDPREVGEALWPGRFPREELERMVGTDHAWNGQIQQNPVPRGGGIFDDPTGHGGFQLIDAVPGKPDNVIRYWDKAATQGGGCYTAGVKMGMYKDGTFIVMDVIYGQWARTKRERVIQETAELDGVEVEVWTEREAGGGGKESAEQTVRNLIGFNAFWDEVYTNKVDRATPYACQVIAGNVYVLKAEWTPEFLREHEKFPNGLYKDIVDAASGAFAKLTRNPPLRGVWGSTN